MHGRGLRCQARVPSTPLREWRVYADAYSRYELCRQIIAHHGLTSSTIASSMGLDNPPELCVDRISVMRYPHISKLDLDLLVHLAVLLEERHVTRAANRCFLSQSAMSRQLERLREALGDELLLRTGRLHERTARGEQLLRELEPLLPRIEGILQGHSFDPAKSKDQFQVNYD